MPTIAELNDKLRMTGQGGQIMMTRTIAELPPEEKLAIIDTFRGFDNFSEDNDPYGEHDFGSFYVRGEQFFFKIDYFDPSMKFASADPADPTITQRVCTVMYAHEY